jgi:crotonobetainyl-CoA:carnitine CoA-transferase CaiB-like acyl-CoA transferase
LSGFGRTGPRAAQPAYDYVLQAMAGWMSQTGDPDGPPTKSGLSLVDYSAGYALGLTLLAAVWRARREGEGGDVDVSLLGVAQALLTYLGTWAATHGHEVPRRAESAHPSIVPFQAFRCADGWITVAAAKEKFWRALRDVLDLPEDERFEDMDARDAHRDELLPILRARFASDTADAWVARLEAAGVPVGKVNDVRGALEEADVVAYDHPRLGTVRQVASPLRLSGHRAPVSPAPARGADTEALLRELCGYDDARLAAARAGGAFGAT